MLGFFRSTPAEFISFAESKVKDEVPAEVLTLVEERAKAKAERNWAVADEIRAKITALGYSVKDTKDGAVIEKL